MENIPQQSVLPAQDMPQVFDAPEIIASDETERQLLINDVLEPYHIHYADGVEGATINPEASERNFDTLLVLTKLIREQRTTNKVDNRKAHSPWFPDPDIDWYFDKYQDQGVGKIAFDQPRKVVSMWLEKLGPHNDMTEATDDLLAARSWLIREHQNITERDGKEASDLLGSAYFGTIADIDMELGEVVDEINQPLYLAEAAAYLDQYIDQQTDAGNIATAAIARMKLATVRIEMRRIKHLDTNQLTTAVDPDDYLRFEEDVEVELENLNKYFHDATTKVTDVYSEVSFADLDDSDTTRHENKFAQSMGALFEVYSYLHVMEDLVANETLATQRFRPGTIREESGTAHKIDDHPNSRVKQLSDGTKVDLAPHGFNFNFDFALTTLKSEIRPGETGHYETVYFQNKMNPDQAPAAKAEAESRKFLAGKHFYFIEPSSIVENFQIGETRRETLSKMLEIMKTVSGQALKDSGPGIGPELASEISGEAPPIS